MRIVHHLQLTLLLLLGLVVVALDRSDAQTTPTFTLKGEKDEPPAPSESEPAEEEPKGTPCVLNYSFYFQQKQAGAPMTTTLAHLEEKKECEKMCETTAKQYALSATHGYEFRSSCKFGEVTIGE